ncbi:MAG: TonB-dependent receptor [Acidobacteria bacterium]|nr:TonB-dependent receptor [Acidobacteriota bacterium]
MPGKALLIGVVAALLGGAGPASAQGSATLQGTVTAAGGLVRLPGVIVVVTAEAGTPPREVVTDGEGRFRLEDLAQGPAVVSVSLEGFERFESRVVLAGGRGIELSVDLAPAGLTERVDVVQRAEDAAMAASLGTKDTLDGSFIRRSAVTDSSLQGALLALPGVVLTPEGLSIRGGRPAQSAVQIGAATIADPSTGIAPLRLPVDAVASVDVMPNPYAVEFGRFSSGITLINTRQGGNRWRLSLNNFDPSFRTRRGRPLDVLGIGSFAPRLGFGGPLAGDRVRVAGSFQYRHTLGEVQSRPQDEVRLQEYLSGLIRLDATISPHHSVSLVLSEFPERRTLVNLDTFTPPEATFDQRQRISNAVVTHSAVLSGNAALASSIQWSRYDARVWPKGGAPLRIAPGGRSGSHFTEGRRKTEAFQWTEALSVYAKGWTGEHLLKAGLDVLGARFEGSSRGGSIEIVRADGTLAREVRFLGPAEQGAATTDVALFAQNRWRPVRAVAVEAGMRLDRDGVLGRTNLTPRVGAAWSFGAGGSFVLRGGAGLFYERPPSSARAFGQLEERVVATFGPDGTTLAGPPVHFAHRADAGLQTPHSFTWSLDLSKQVNRWFTWRIGHLQRKGRDELIVDALVDGAAGTLLLSSGGRSRYRETEASLGVVPGRDSELRVSYVHSSAEGDLNAFSSLFGAGGDPLVRPNEWGPLPGDLRRRLILRGHALPRGKWFLETAVDWRSGFPYSALDERQDYAGPRNRAGRFPSSAVVDIAVERRIRVLSWRPWIGVRLKNAFNAFAPLDVQQNAASPLFGAFYDSVPRRAHFIVRLER